MKRLPDPPGKLRVADIGKPRGLQGELRVKNHMADVDSLSAYGPLEQADGRTLKVVSAKPDKGVAFVRFEGVDNRDKAEALVGTRLYIDRERLPEPDDADDFYYTDLIGLTVIGASGEALGKVTSVQDFGAGDLLDIVPVPGGAVTKGFFLPFTKACVPEVDVAGGRLIAHPPEGLLDDDVDPE